MDTDKALISKIRGFAMLLKFHLVLTALLLRGVSAAGPCDDLLDSIDPCTCYKDDLFDYYVLDCSEVANAQDFFSIPGFQNGQSLQFDAIKIEYNKDLKEVPSGAFGNHRTINRLIFSINEALESIAPSIFEENSDAKEILVAYNYLLRNFDFGVIANHPNVVEFAFHYNDLVNTIPANAFSQVRSSGLQRILFQGPFASVGEYAFRGVPAGTEVYLWYNTIENGLQTLAANTLRFDQRPRSVFLVANGISTIDSNFMGGGEIPTEIFDFGNNQLETVDRNVWEQILQKMSDSGLNTIVNFIGNPIKCDCRMKWLAIDRSEFRKYFKAPEGDGDSILCTDVDAESPPSLWDVDQSIFGGC